MFFIYVNLSMSSSLDLSEVENLTDDKLDNLIEENPSRLEKYIVGSVLEGWSRVTRNRPYDIDVVIVDEFTLKSSVGDLGTAGKHLEQKAIILNDTEFAIHIHDKDELDKSGDYMRF